ncbi:MAG: GNAT family N-acetyltransferase [Candidatus Izemoplasma sp.]
MILNELNKHFTKFDIRVIQEDDLEDLYRLQLSNSSYFSLTQENKVTFNDCIRGTKTLPPNTIIDQKYYLGFFRGRKLEVIIDFITDYPEKHIIWIGLLMVDGKLKRQGLGTSVIEAMKIITFKLNYLSLQLGVIEPNKKALEFWNAMGFVEFRRSKTIENDKLGPDVIVLKFTL